MTKKSKFEKLIQERQSTILAGYILILESQGIIDEARKGFVTVDVARKFGETATNLKGKELIQWAEAFANSRNEKWFKEWFSEEDES